MDHVSHSFQCSRTPNWQNNYCGGSENSSDRTNLVQYQICYGETIRRTKYCRSSPQQPDSPNVSKNEELTTLSSCPQAYSCRALRLWLHRAVVDANRHFPFVFNTVLVCCSIYNSTIRSLISTPQFVHQHRHRVTVRTIKPPEK